jgi:hypothetical protein
LCERRAADVSWRAEMMMTSLCETCHNMREVRTARSRFLLCELSVTDTAYPKYPPQPVVRCGGYRPRDEHRQGDPPDLHAGPAACGTTP